MTEIFLPSDAILGSAGVLPVFYWLVREAPLKSDAYIREFLVTFERERRENRALAKSSQQVQVDSQMVRYYQMNRSPDDPVSHEGRFKILMDRLRKFRPS
jgi:hypothetical protein